MNLSAEIKIGKKYIIYLPRKIVKALNIKEGDKAVLTVIGNKVVIELIPDPIELALSSKKFVKITQEELEAISVEEQEKYVESIA